MIDHENNPVDLTKGFTLTWYRDRQLIALQQNNHKVYWDFCEGKDDKKILAFLRTSNDFTDLVELFQQLFNLRADSFIHTKESISTTLAPQ